MEEERVAQLIRLPEWKSILLDLVERNELDPWNIDIVRLAQLYLEEIVRRREMDLYLPANAVLASSILLWLKARVLREAKEVLEEKEEVPELPEVEEVEDVVIALEPEPKEAVIPPSRLVRRRVTLEELLSIMERLMKERGKKKEVKVHDVVLPEIEEEDVEDYIEEVYREILSKADSTGLVLFSAIAKSDPLDFVKKLLAVLYLANEGKLDVFQEEVFGDIFIRVKG